MEKKRTEYHTEDPHARATYLVGEGERKYDGRLVVPKKAQNTNDVALALRMLDAACAGKANATKGTKRKHDTDADTEADTEADTDAHKSAKKEEEEEEEVQ